MNKIMLVLFAAAAIVTTATLLSRRGIGSGGTVDAGSFIT